MAGVYRSRHPERTVLYRVLFYHFDRFLTEYERRFEREYGFFRPIVKEVVEILRVFFKYKRGLLGDLCRCALRSLICYFEAVTGSALTPGIIAAIQTFILSWPHTGFKVHSHIFIARVTSHIPDKGQVMVRYYGLYANAHIYRSPETDVRGSEASALQSHGFHEGRRPMFSSRLPCRRPRRAGNIVEYFVIGRERESIVF